MIRVELINMKIKITYETERSLILRNRTRTRAWCERCNAEADFVPNQEIVSLAIRLNKNGEDANLHKFNLPDGKILICLASLLKNGT